MFELLQVQVGLIRLDVCLLCAIVRSRIAPRSNFLIVSDTLNFPFVVFDWSILHLKASPHHPQSHTSVTSGILISVWIRQISQNPEARNRKPSWHGESDLPESSPDRVEREPVLVLLGLSSHFMGGKHREAITQNKPDWPWNNYSTSQDVRQSSHPGLKQMSWKLQAAELNFNHVISHHTKDQWQ